MTEKEPEWLQHPEDEELYFEVVRKRPVHDGGACWDTFQVVDNDRASSAQQLRAITQTGLTDPEKLSVMATQVINTTIEGVKTKIVLHVPAAVDKADLLKSKERKVSIGDCKTLFLASFIH